MRKEIFTIRKLYFDYREISKVLDISLASARVTANRYVKQGLLIRGKRNIYILSERWRNLTREEKFVLASVIQVPSYVSLMTALDYYELTTQLQREFIESIAIKRTKEVSIDGNIFNYSKIEKKLYFGFVREKDFFIATPEKALLDAAYLMSLKRYSFDINSVDIGKFDKKKLKRLAEEYPEKTIKLLEKHE